MLLPWALAFDPQAWVVWGRDAARLALDTRGGPSWKPLPVVVTTPLSLTGDPAPALWLLVARAGGLLALAGAWALAARLGGTAAGAAAAGVMALSSWWMFNTALGNSEGLLAAAVLWAVLAHLAGLTRAALALATAAALLRPEVWPFLGLYGVWLWRRDRAARAAVVTSAIVVPLLWLGPDVLGIGGALSASRAARGEPSLGSAALEDVPGLAVLADAVSLLTVPATVAAVVGTIIGGPLARALAAAAAAWIAIVAVMAQAGYAGNPRYLVAAMAYGCVLAGAGAAWAGAAIARRGRAAGGTARAAGPASAAAGAAGPASAAAGAAGPASAAAGAAGPASPAAGAASPAIPAAGAAGPAIPAAGAASPAIPAAGAAGPAIAAAVLVAAVGAVTLADLGDQMSDVGARADRRAALPAVVAAAGGRDALVTCTRVRTAPDVRPLVAWELDISMLGIDRPPEAPGTVLRWSPHGGGPMEPAIPAGFRLLGRAPYWEAWGTCRVRR